MYYVHLQPQSLVWSCQNLPPKDLWLGTSEMIYCVSGCLGALYEWVIFLLQEERDLFI